MGKKLWDLFLNKKKIILEIKNKTEKWKKGKNLN